MIEAPFKIWLSKGELHITAPIPALFAYLATPVKRAKKATKIKWRTYKTDIDCDFNTEVAEPLVQENLEDKEAL